MDILRKSLAPISAAAWEEINDTAINILKSVLSARKFVDVEGPKGLDYSAVPTGRLNIPAGQKGKVKFGINQVLPLVEARIPFELDIWELDNIARGARDLDLSALEDAAREMAKFEESVIYDGMKTANIKGLKNSSDYTPIAFPKTSEDVVSTVAKAVAQLKAKSIEGPYTLVLGSEKWQLVNSFGKGYPLKKQIESLLGGSIILAPNITDAYLVSERGGDFELTIGQDISIGYESHNNKKVQLYFTESFTFQVIEPASVVVFE